jgi:hypothetical protein
MSQLAALSASLEADFVNEPENVADALAVLGTCVSRMLARGMRRHEILADLFPEENAPAVPIVALGRGALQILVKQGYSIDKLDDFIERILRHAI